MWATIVNFFRSNPIVSIIGGIILFFVICCGGLSTCNSDDGGSTATKPAVTAPAADGEATEVDAYSSPEAFKKASTDCGKKYPLPASSVDEISKLSENVDFMPANMEKWMFIGTVIGFLGFGVFMFMHVRMGKKEWKRALSIYCLVGAFTNWVYEWIAGWALEIFAGLGMPLHLSYLGLFLMPLGILMLLWPAKAWVKAPRVILDAMVGFMLVLGGLVALHNVSLQYRFNPASATKQAMATIAAHQAWYVPAHNSIGPALVKPNPKGGRFHRIDFGCGRLGPGAILVNRSAPHFAVGEYGPGVFIEVDPTSVTELGAIVECARQNDLSVWERAFDWEAVRNQGRIGQECWAEAIEKQDDYDGDETETREGTGHVDPYSAVPAYTGAGQLIVGYRDTPDNRERVKTDEPQQLKVTGDAKVTLVLCQTEWSTKPGEQMHVDARWHGTFVVPGSSQRLALIPGHTTQTLTSDGEKGFISLTPESGSVVAIAAVGSGTAREVAKICPAGTAGWLP